uniref:FAD-dependent oxidoreductase n=1 Tax=uncultured Allobacillus sp. TaxID=1638025 RepID=UPI0025950575|nr:FAD-dependent oxidoreductase [uncultured Allobacillus sp.]
MKQLKEIHGERIEVFIDGNKTTIPKGLSLATVLMQQKGLAFSELEDGIKRAPICNMGVCYECSVQVQGQGTVRSCMTKAVDGMEVFTTGVRVSNERETTVDVDQKEEMKLYDVAIIGSGPAGLGALDELVTSDLQIAVLDEQDLPGGQIYRQPPKEFRLTGSHEKFVFKHKHHPDVDWYMKCAVLSVEQQTILNGQNESEEIFILHIDNQKSIRARTVILGAGAYDRLLTIPGWHIPGVMAAGALQVFAKSQKFVPGKDIVLTGTHPFLLIAAAEIIQLGGNVKSIYLSQSVPSIKEVLAFAFQGMKQLGKAKELLRAYRMIQKAGVDIHLGFVPSAIEGNEIKKSVRFSKLSADGSTVDFNENLYVNCDLFGMNFGFNASSELARQAGCEMEFVFQDGGWIAKQSDDMESTIKSLFVVGEITGVGGAELAQLEGRIAGLAIRRKQGESVEQTIRKYKQLKRQAEPFANMLNEQTTLSQEVLYQLLNQQGTHLCKCEQVTTDTMNQALMDFPSLSSLSSLKLYTRCGMGLCQGRYCENSLRTWFEKQTGKQLQEDQFNMRHPVKPVLIKDFISK